MTIHITDLGVEGCKRVCILYDCRRERTPAGNGSYKKKRILIGVHSVARMAGCLMMSLAGPGSAFEGNEFGGGGFQLFYIFLMKAVAVTENLEL